MGSDLSVPDHYLSFYLKSTKEKKPLCKDVSKKVTRTKLDGGTLLNTILMLQNSFCRS